MSLITHAKQQCDGCHLPLSLFQNKLDLTLGKATITICPVCASTHQPIISAIKRALAAAQGIVQKGLD